LQSISCSIEETWAKRLRDGNLASPIFEIALVLVRLDQVASGIVNVNHGLGAALIG
jgi:hypothetical protein